MLTPALTREPDETSALGLHRRGGNDGSLPDCFASTTRQFYKSEQREESMKPQLSLSLTGG